MVIEELLLRVSVDTSQSNALDTFQSRINRLQSSISHYAEETAKFVYNSIKDVIKTYSSFEDALSVARRTMGLTQEEINELGQGLLDMSTELGGISVDVLAEITGIAGTAGLSFKLGKQNMYDFVEAIAKIKVTTDLTARKASERILAIGAVYGIALEDMGSFTKQFGNVLVHLGDSMNATQEQISRVSSNIAGTMVSAGFTWEEMLGYSAALASVEKRFGTAGTALIKMLNRMGTEYKDWAKALSLDSEELRKAIEENPVKAMKMVLYAVEDIEKREGPIGRNLALKDLGLQAARVGDVFKKMVKGVEQVEKGLRLVEEAKRDQEILDRKFAVSMETFTNQWTSWKTIIDNIKKMIGGPLVQAMADLLQFDLNPLMREFYAWVRESTFLKETWPTIIEQIKDGILRLVERAKEFGTYLIENWPQIWETIKQEFGNIIDTIKDIIETVKTIGITWEQAVTSITSFGEAIKPLKAILKPIWDISLEISNVMLKMIEMVADVIQGIQKIAQTIGETVEPIITSLSGSVQGVVQTIENAFNRLIALKEKVSAVFQGGATAPEKTSYADEDLESFVNGIAEGAKKTTENIQQMTQATNEATQAVVILGEKAVHKSTFPDMAQSIQQAYATMNTLTASVRQGEQAIRGLDTQHQSLSATVEQYSDQIQELTLEISEQQRLADQSYRLEKMKIEENIEALKEKKIVLQEGLRTAREAAEMQKRYYLGEQEALSVLQAKQREAQARFHQQANRYKQIFTGLTEETKKWLFENENAQAALASVGIQMDVVTQKVFTEAQAEWESSQAIQQKNAALEAMAQKAVQATQATHQQTTAIQEQTAAIQQQNATVQQHVSSLSSWTESFSMVTDSSKNYTSVLNSLSAEAQKYLAQASSEKVLKELGKQQTWFAERTVKRWQATQRSQAKAQANISGIEASVQGLIANLTNWEKQQRGLTGFQTGGYVPTTGPAYLHQGEYVLNRQQMTNLRNPQSGGTPITINISGKVIDRQALQYFTREIRQELTRQGALRVGGNT